VLRITNAVVAQVLAEAWRVYPEEACGLLLGPAGLGSAGTVHTFRTHTAAYPSATDIAEATKPLVPPSWHWLIVSLGWGFPEMRSFAVDPSRGHFGMNSATGIAEETLLLTE